MPRPPIAKHCSAQTDANEQHDTFVKSKQEKNLAAASDNCRSGLTCWVGHCTQPKSGSPPAMHCPKPSQAVPQKRLQHSAASVSKQRQFLEGRLPRQQYFQSMSSQRSASCLIKCKVKIKLIFVKAKIGKAKAFCFRGVQENVRRETQLRVMISK